MKKIEKVEVYRCKCCLEYHTYSEKDAEYHLTQCVANPDNKACLMCKHVIKHNVIDEVTKKPAFIYGCKKHERELNDIELTMLGAECFEERSETQIPYTSTDAYTEYLEKTVKKIQDTIS